MGRCRAHRETGGDAKGQAFEFALI
jgi:hypothetical protein